MTLLLDGQQIRGKRMKVTAALRIETGDLSGQTSNTDTAHKGFKPKTLAVSLMIPFVDHEHLRAIMRLAEATAKGGQLKMYRVVNDSAAAFGIREVQFAEGVSAREDDTLAAWLVQFTLSEKLSNPEKVEQRKGANGVNSQSAPGQGVAGKDGEAELSGFEKVLKKVDDYLAPTP
ncbi:DNA-binding protein [Pseudomonas gingeri NCPPB 3146 = LMG 5327]|uniref:DNA-binding protein n=2 Tax=Pseudomonas gingeri TaxID=117681 RepID=A0A7Y8CFJ2_9PSED|nr:hypothetical protein [Pseudomonas gingeri]NWC16211.1 DNA-binding protein [Pseudomonas gingeri]PNQ90363.1 DNA-binding protein [Pseudomonas gingeri NCPPB 3146 = LMG 5327]